MEKIIETPTLHMAVEVSGPKDGRPVILIHGWPDCARTWDNVIPILHDAGYQTFVPSLRGFGNTQFRFEQTRRTGGFFAFAQDIKDLIDTLSLAPVRIIGQDWGAFTALTLSNLWGTDVVKAEMVLAEGWQTFGNLSIQQIQNFWYQWFLTTEQGSQYIRDHGKKFGEYMWAQWSPQYSLTERDRTSFQTAFANPNWVTITLNTYRERWGYAPTDGHYEPLAERTRQDSSITVPTFNIIGKDDGCTDYHLAESMQTFMTGAFKQEFWDQTGHFIQREQPERLAAASIQWFEQIDQES